MAYLLVGTITKTVGLKGEVRIYPSTHFRDSRFKIGSHLFLLNENGEILRELTVAKHHRNGNLDQVIFSEISSIDEAEKIVKQKLYVEKDRSFLKKDEYFFDDLIGLTVEFDNGTKIGEVVAIEEYTSYATLRVKGQNKKDVLVPFVNAFIKDVDLENKKIVVNYIEGLVWELQF